MNAPSSNSFEFYETPQAFSRYLFRTVPVHGRLFEPCVGTGAIVSAHHDSGYYRAVTNDIDPRHGNAMTHLDATTPEPWLQAGTIDWTVTNPPYSCAFEIIERALEHSLVGVAVHLRLSALEVHKRGAYKGFFERHPPTGMLFLPRFSYQRSRTTGKWASDLVASCWVIWRRDPSALPFLRWAPDWVLRELAAETDDYRARMDRLAQEWGAVLPSPETPAAAPEAAEEAQP